MTRFQTAKWGDYSPFWQNLGCLIHPWRTFELPWKAVTFFSSWLIPWSYFDVLVTWWWPCVGEGSWDYWSWSSTTISTAGAECEVVTWNLALHCIFALRTGGRRWLREALWLAMEMETVDGAVTSLSAAYSYELGAFGKPEITLIFWEISTIIQRHSRRSEKCWWGTGTVESDTLIPPFKEIYG